MVLSVRDCVSDGATPNRKFLKNNDTTGEQYQGITHCIKNKNARGQKIFFICDVPYLLKTVRNNLENSHGHLNSKNLIKYGHSVSWAYVVSTVEKDMTHYLTHLVKIKGKNKHIHLSP